MRRQGTAKVHWRVAGVRNKKSATRIDDEAIMQKSSELTRGQ